MEPKNTLKERTEKPKDYGPIADPIVRELGGEPRFPLPTPPNPGYAPSPIFRSPLPTLLADPDQQRQFYGRGMNIRRFWPNTNGTTGNS